IDAVVEDDVSAGQTEADLADQPVAERRSQRGDSRKRDATLVAVFLAVQYGTRAWKHRTCSSYVHTVGPTNIRLIVVYEFNVVFLGNVVIEPRRTELPIVAAFALKVQTVAVVISIACNPALQTGCVAGQVSNLGQRRCNERVGRR